MAWIQGATQKQKSFGSFLQNRTFFLRRNTPEPAKLPLS
jgi:hypothetical protein